jgi:hypothetical protein
MTRYIREDEQDPVWRRWYQLLDGLRGRFADEHLDEINEQCEGSAMLGPSALLGGHEQGMYQLTPEEERELWDLAAEWELRDDDVVNIWTRRKSVRNRPIPGVRMRHPLTGGAHGWGRCFPGKSEFPEQWRADDIFDRLEDVARRPSGAVRLPTGDFRAWGERDGVQLSVVLSPEGELVTGYATAGEGVAVNALDEQRLGPVRRLQALLDALLPDATSEPRVSLDELLAVGEWPHVIRSLQTLPLTPDQERDLDEIADLAALPPGRDREKKD